ncbi:NTP transferase domain-containing protein [Candidatus Berkelbacteria bacterium]|nr:NTP transferase domain-containing protein [Candidatus Berkelbacteria bacterium]
MTNLHAIVLAAGKGKRLNAELLPKVLYELGGHPMILYVLESLKGIGIPKPIIVVGFQGEKIIELLGKQYDYVWQSRQLGTAHAALQAAPYLKNKSGHTFILNGDNPMVQPKTLKRMIARVGATKATLAIASAKVPDTLELGHLITDKNGHVTKIVEEKNATTAEKSRFKWKNAGPWLVENKFLWHNLPKIAKNPISKEYYLTDLLELAVGQGKRAIAVTVTDISEAIGINTLKHLELAQKAHEKKSQNPGRHS